MTAPMCEHEHEHEQVNEHAYVDDHVYAYASGVVVVVDVVDRSPRPWLLSSYADLAPWAAWSCGRICMICIAMRGSWNMFRLGASMRA